MKAPPFLVSEDKLLRMLNRRDELAFQWLYDQYAHVLYGVVLTSVGEPALASRVVEDVFVNAWLEFDQYNPAKIRLLSWLLVRARAEVVRTLEKKVLPTPRAIIEYEVIGNPVTEEQRILIDAVYFRGQSITQLALASKQPESALQHRLHNVLKELKSLFSQ